jgi:tetrahydromethanopterin S-methyltransferase subunit A
MQTKLSQLKEAYHAGDTAKAIRIAARFPDLGAHRNAILDANIAITNPRWTLNMKRDVDQTIADGIAALRIRYSL